MATISSSRQQPLSMSGALNTNPLNGSNNNRPPSQRPRLPHVDPSIDAEYPIYISDRLKKKREKEKKQQKQQDSQSSPDSGSPAKASELLAIAYNTKPKATLNTHRVQIFPSSKTPQGTPGTKYKLTIQEKENESQTWTYHGSHDPKTIHEKAQQASGDNRTSVNGNGNGNSNDNGSPREKSVVLMYNHDEKAFILEEVDAKLNFNMVKNSKEPGVSLKERYEQLMVADGSDTSSSNEDGWDEELEDIDPSNPYDWRHFAKKARDDELLKADEKQLRETATPSQASPHSLRPSSSQSNVARFGKSSTPMPEPAKPAAARERSKGKAAAVAGAAAKSTTSETTTSTAKTKSRTITNPLRQPAKRKPGRPPGSTAAAKANAAKVKSAERMPKDDEPDEDDNGSKAEHEYKDGEIIDLPTFEPPTTSAPKKGGPQKKTGSQKTKKDEAQEELEIHDDDEDEETHDRRSMPPPPKPSNGNNVEVGESAIDGKPLVIEWPSPERKRSPLYIDQSAAGFGQVDEDDGLEHVGLASMLQAKRKEEEQRKRQSAMDMDDEEDEDRDSDADEDDDGDDDGDGNGEDAGADAIEAELLNLFQQSEHQSDQPAIKQRDDDESSVSEEE